ncbi:MAG: hypothetical protein AAGF24_10015 [Cyanobacteria bacterium P01_H01_bin.121]
MRAYIQNEVLHINNEDVPAYKQGGSVVRNSYFWALKSIAAQARRDRDWEYEAEVWLALQRLLLSFAASGYLGLRETQLEFDPEQTIPELLRDVATWS